MLTVKVIPEIEKTPRVCGGGACIVSTRIPVWFLEDLRRSGLSDKKILDAYPQLERKQIRAAWTYVEQNRDEIDRAIRENEDA